MNMTTDRALLERVETPAGGAVIGRPPPLPFVRDDGGRSAAGFRGSARDCVARSVAIAARLPYVDVYARLAEETGRQRASRLTKKRPRSARNGINTKRKWFRDYMQELGFVWHPTMRVGQGCTVHLVAGELPARGRLVVSVSRHYTALIDGVIHDTGNPQRRTLVLDADGFGRVVYRCVYGYWMLQE